MKIKNILISGLGVLALTACNDFLEVDAPSKYTTDIVFNSDNEIKTALNGVYAKAMSNSTFGNALYNTVMLNSDVDFTANSNENAQSNTPRRFDVTASGSSVKNLWEALYDGIESANEFIYNLEHSSLYKKEGTSSKVIDKFGNEQTVYNTVVTDYTQMMGEAKMLRAMFYSELLWYFGDVPFTLEPTWHSGNLTPDVTARKSISDALIADLADAAEYMNSDQNLANAPERISKEAVYSMIARLALQAGGYSLNHVDNNGNEVGGYGVMTRPDNYKDYYKIALDYTDRVIIEGNHGLKKSYSQFFIDECSYVTPKADDDAIFEIPFGKNDTGNWGYYQGPTCSSENGKTSYSDWGECSGSVRTTAFYMYDFEDGDARREYTCGLWYYPATGIPTMRYDYAMHNNKWSKLWSQSPMGNQSTGSTGINFAYIRYADVLLMNAEAANELGDMQKAKDDLVTVRTRAFANPMLVNKYNSVSNKEDLLKAILDERKFEFAGENLRWKDLVRNNMYAETIYWTFLTYYSVGAEGAGYSEYYEQIKDAKGIDYMTILPNKIYSFKALNTGDGKYFTNKDLPIFYVVQPYGKADDPTGLYKTPTNYVATFGLNVTPLSEQDITGDETKSAKIEWTSTSVFAGSWGNDNGIKAQCLYSFYGYIRGGLREGEIVLNYGPNDMKPIDPASFDVTKLPPLRYLLPYPNEAIQRGGGKYSQNYGY